MPYREQAVVPHTEEPPVEQINSNADLDHALLWLEGYSVRSPCALKEDLSRTAFTSAQTSYRTPQYRGQELEKTSKGQVGFYSDQGDAFFISFREFRKAVQRTREERAPKALVKADPSTIVPTIVRNRRSPLKVALWSTALLLTTLGYLILSHL